MRKRVFAKTSAWLLLAIFVTMTVFSDFHRHKVVNVLSICENCQHNLPHPNHISQSVSYESICLLCQWSGSAFNIPILSNITVFLAFIQSIFCSIALKYRRIALQKLTNKAPPVC